MRASIRRTVGLFAFASIFTIGCGGGGGVSLSLRLGPSINIDVPTSSASFSITWTDIRLGGTISNASFVSVRNDRTGFTTEGFVNYFDGHGTWFADVQGLEPGNNVITVTANSGESNSTSASVQITVIRPISPADLIINGADQISTASFWTDESSFGSSHKIVLFADGTGRSTTGSVLSENAGAVVDFRWSETDPETIAISDCPTCSFQRMTRISGSTNEELFYGQVDTVGGTGEIALHAFSLNPGKL